MVEKPIPRIQIRGLDELKDQKTDLQKKKETSMVMKTETIQKEDEKLI